MSVRYSPSTLPSQTGPRPGIGGHPRPVPRSRIHLRRLVALAIVLGSLATGGVYAFAGGGPTVVSVFPIPGARVASPSTQIAFRGLPVDQLGTIVVTGSRSGRHPGRLEADSDGDGGSFLPAKPFLPGEVVTVQTALHVRGARRGAFRFTVATPAGPIQMVGLAPAPRTPGDLALFHSRPDLAPPAVEITKRDSDPGQGDVLVTPQQGPVQNGPMIVAPDGSLVWFDPLPEGEMAANLRVQRYQGKPVLTWWQGTSGAGLGMGEDVIEDASYQRIAVVHAGNGLSADLHEFQLTRRGTALITAYYPVYWNASSVHGPSRAVLLDSVVQEIDVKTGLVLFQWNSLDHVPLTNSYESLPRVAGHPYDYFHVNSVELAKNGDLIISARNTWAAYDVSSSSGKVIWELGGKHSSFALSQEASFAFQHDVRVHSSQTRKVTVFDDGAGPPAVHRQSRGLTLRLDEQHRRATVEAADQHSPPLLVNFEGNDQSLKDGDQFVGWGQQPYFTEFDPQGQIVFDGRFVDANSSYRAYRYPWRATPRTSPSAIASTSGTTTTVYASWNGATTVVAWRALAGGAPGAMRPMGSSPKQGFETELTIPASGYVAVQALDARGRVLATSKPVRAGS